MMKVLLDTNIILDILLKRQLFFKDAINILKLCEAKTLHAFLSSNTITDIYYIIKKQYGHQESIILLKNILNYLFVLPVNNLTIQNALNSKIFDFEDAIQIEVSIEYNLDMIITRNQKDFFNNKIVVITPKEFLQKYFK